MEEAWNQLLSPHETRFLEKELLGWLTLLENDKVGDLSMMHLLVSKVKWRGGLDIASRIFKENVIEVGMALVKEAEDCASSHKLMEKRLA